MFNHTELKNLEVFLKRTQLHGEEALVLVLLQQKLAQMIKESEPAPEVKEAPTQTPPNDQKE